MVNGGVNTTNSVLEREPQPMSIEEKMDTFLTTNGYIRGYYCKILDVEEFCKWAYKYKWREISKSGDLIYDKTTNAFFNAKTGKKTTVVFHAAFQIIRSVTGHYEVVDYFGYNGYYVAPHDELQFLRLMIQKGILGPRLLTYSRV